ncbi:MAG: preprotein translocase subunit SecE [Bryobacteraceae bacterium]|jgi:preprotein translocase subunit SecE|nr:preprotein translocase subunit SecE [Bryobacteraceae bacterium]
MAAQTTAVAANGGAGKKALSLVNRVRDYIDDLKTEMKHVTWPAKKQVQATTAVVIIAVFMFAAYFAAVDLLLGRAINTIFDSLAKR